MCVWEFTQHLQMHTSEHIQYTHVTQDGHTCKDYAQK